MASTDGPRYTKDAFDRAIVHGEADAVNPAQTGTKAAAHYHLTVAAGATATIRLRLNTHAPGSAAASLSRDFDAILDQRGLLSLDPRM